METQGPRGSRCQESWWSAPRGSGPWKHTLLDGQAALALELIDVKDMCTEGGEELVFRELDQRFPDKVAADRMGEAMEETFGLNIMKNETTEALGDQDVCSLVCSRKVLTCRQKAQGYIVLRGCRLGSPGRATIMSATRRRWKFEEENTAIRTSFLGCPPNWWSHGAFSVDELEDRGEDEPQDHVEGASSDVLTGSRSALWLLQRWRFLPPRMGCSSRTRDV